MHRYLLVAATALTAGTAHVAPAGAITWESPEVISGVAPGFDTLAVAADAGGDATATWRGGATPGIPHHAERSDGFWGEPDTLGSMFTNAVRLATNAAGDAVAVWDACAQSCLYAAVREAGGAWQDAILVSGGPSLSVPHYDYGAAVDPDGDATIVFKRGDAISTRSRVAGGTWAAAVPVVTDASARASGVAVDASGTVFVLSKADGLAGTVAKLAVRPPLEAAWGASVTVAEDVTETTLAVSPAGDATVVSRSSNGALTSRTRTAEGTLEEAHAISAGPVSSPRAAIGSGGHVVAAWDQDGELKLASRAPDEPWSQPLVVPDADSAPALAVDAAGNALLASETVGAGDARLLRVQTVSAAGAVGAPSLTPATVGREITPAATVTPDGHGTVVWEAGSGTAYAIHAMSTNDPIAADTGAVDDGDEGGEETGGGDPGTGAGTPPPAGGSGAPQHPAGPAGPATIDTLRTVAMPRVTGKDETAAKEAIGDAGIQARFKVALSSRKPPRGVRVGDVVLQSPKPGTQVTSGFATLLPVKLTVYGGPARRGARCPKKVMRALRSGLRGMDLVDAERLVEKQGCYVQRDFRIADVDEAQVTAIADTGRRRNGRPIVRLTVSVPSDVARNDLFLGFRESPNQLSFGAEDWALTASSSQRNFLSVIVKNRTAVAIPGTDAVLHGVEQGAEIHFDTTDVGSPVDAPVQTSDKHGQLTTSLLVPKAGTVDVIAVKTGSNGLSMYGIGRLTVRDRRDLEVGDSYRTTGGRLLERGRDGFFCKEGPGDVCKQPVAYIKEGARAAQAAPRARAAAFDPFGGLASLLSSLIGSFAPGNPGIDAAKRELAAGRSPLATVQAVAAHRVHLVQFSLSGKPLSPLAKAIAAGGGNVIAAGGGNAIAAGGGNVIAAGGGNAIAAGGGNAIAAGGGNAIAAGGGNVIAAGGGNVIRLPGGGQAIAAGGGNVIAAGGGNLWPTSAIAAGGGN